MDQSEARKRTKKHGTCCCSSPTLALFALFAFGLKLDPKKVEISAYAEHRSAEIYISGSERLPLPEPGLMYITDHITDHYL